MAFVSQYSLSIKEVIENSTLWRLQASFNKVINIVNDQQKIITLHLNEIPKVPMSIVVDGFPPISGDFYLPSILDFSKATPWDPLIPYYEIKDWEIVVKRAKLLKEWLYKQDKKGMFLLIEETPLGERVMENIQLLIDSWKHEESIDYEKTCSGIMGLGSGLTPSSDDVLCGVLAAIYGGAPFHRKIEYSKEFFLNIIPYGYKFTNTLSANFIKHYSKGFASELILDLISVLYTGSNQEWLNQIEEVDSWGGSSGRDILFGFSLGFENIINM